jgi:GT2 family glycosyltransferase
VTVIELDRNLGFAGANNVVLETVTSPYVALLNNDAVPHPSWLSALKSALDARPEAGFAASRMVFADSPGVIDRAGDSYTRAGAGRLRGRGEPVSRYDKSEFVFGACAGAALYRTELLDEIGLFDEDFFILYEDVDLSFRAQLMGYRCLYVPEAVVHHRVSSSITHDSWKSIYYGHRNLEWVYVKDMPRGLILRTLPQHLVYDLLSFCYFASNLKAGPFLKGKVDALRGIVRVLKKRQKVQSRRKTSSDYVWGLLEKERFFSRMAARKGRSVRA